MTSVPSDARMRQAFNVLEKHVETKYGIPILIRDVPNPFTGDLDGAEIHVDYAEDIESALFIIAHLFGHTVQWNVSEASRQIAFYQPGGAWPEDKLREAIAYEAEACQYSLQLLHEAGVHDLDQWVADFAACDAAYLVHFYTTGEKRPFREFWRDGAPILPPKPIPAFQPTAWLTRSGGTVV